MMSATSRLLFGMLLSVLLPALAHAADYKFHLYNKTTKYKITGFQTFENDKWSTWSDVVLTPGEDQEMVWGSKRRSLHCSVPYHVREYSDRTV
jgi:hypothetical protein